MHFYRKPLKIDKTSRLGQDLRSNEVVGGALHKVKCSLGLPMWLMSKSKSLVSYVPKTSNPSIPKFSGHWHLDISWALGTLRSKEQLIIPPAPLVFSHYNVP